MRTFLKNPGRTLKKVEAILSAWENLAPEAKFYEMTAAEFRDEVNSMLKVRERIGILEMELDALLQKRVLIDEQCHGKAISVVSGVRGCPEHGPNSPLYAAMGYIPDGSKKAGRPRKNRTAAR
jgi:hypothetical protein